MPRPWEDVLWDALRTCGAPSPGASARVSDLLNAIEDRLGLDSAGALSTAARVRRAARETEVPLEADVYKDHVRTCMQSYASFAR